MCRQCTREEGWEREEGGGRGQWSGQVLRCAGLPSRNLTRTSAEPHTPNPVLSPVSISCTVSSRAFKFSVTPATGWMNSSWTNGSKTPLRHDGGATRFRSRLHILAGARLQGCDCSPFSRQHCRYCELRQSATAVAESETVTVVGQADPSTQGLSRTGGLAASRTVTNLHRHVGDAMVGSCCGVGPLSPTCPR